MPTAAVRLQTYHQQQKAHCRLMLMLEILPHAQIQILSLTAMFRATIKTLLMYLAQFLEILQVLQSVQEISIQKVVHAMAVLM